jgi:hypothetical protein
MDEIYLEHRLFINTDVAICNVNYVVVIGDKI